MDYEALKFSLPRGDASFEVEYYRGSRKLGRLSLATVKAPAPLPSTPPPAGSAPLEEGVAYVETDFTKAVVTVNINLANELVKDVPAMLQD